jgi:hypothetical protein
MQRFVLLTPQGVAFGIVQLPLFTMPLPPSPALSDCSTVCDTFLQYLAHAEQGLRTLLPDLTVMTGLVLFYYLLTLAALDLGDWWLWRQDTRVSRLLAKFQRVREKLAGRGQHRRLRLARLRQRRNLKELASLVEAQLHASKGHLHPDILKRTRVVIDKSVTSLDFDRLYSLHHLLSQADKRQVAPRLERFFQHVR